MGIRDYFEHEHEHEHDYDFDNEHEHEHEHLCLPRRQDSPDQTANIAFIAQNINQQLETSYLSEEFPPMDMTQQAHQVALEVVQKNCTTIGMAAAMEGYPQVWARDSMITFLGAALARTPAALAAFAASLETLGQYQDRHGQIPYLVWVEDNRTSFGSADANPWFVIGAAYYAALTGDAAWAARIAPAIVKALDWCDAQDVDRCGLMESAECADWADLLANHGKVLFPNVLYARALQVGAALVAPTLPAEAARLQAIAGRVQAALQTLFWVQEDGPFEDASHGKVRTLMRTTLRKRPYFLSWVYTFDFGDRFDTTANLLAILTGVATPAQADAILDYVEQTGCNRPFPVRVLYPPILPGEPEWRDYYLIYNLNRPHQYHNGGIWPWVGGLYVAALVKAGRREKAAEELTYLARALAQGRVPWEVNEWLHGESGQPMGMVHQAWSAGMYLYAHHAVATGDTPGLG